MKSKRDLIVATIEDIVSDLLYYDRKEDDLLPRGAIEQAIRDGEISVEEIIDIFTNELWESLDEV